MAVVAYFKGYSSDVSTVRFGVLMAVRMTMFFWVLTPCRVVGIDTNVSEKHTIYIFSAEVRIDS
jgi:hypothetical protein